MTPLDPHTTALGAFAIGLGTHGTGIQPTIIESWAPFLDAVQSLEILKRELHKYFETRGSDFRRATVKKIIQWGRDESSAVLSNPIAYRRLKKELYELQLSVSAFKHHVPADKLRLACEHKLGIADNKGGGHCRL